MAKLRINPIYLLIVLLFAYFGWLLDIIIYLLVLILHEYTHFYVSKFFGYKIDKMKIDFYGAKLVCPEIKFQPKHEIIISLSAPILNLFLFLLCLGLWWIFPQTYFYLFTFAVANFSLGIFNLLPILPLDMGRVILTILKSRTRIALIYKIFKIISVISAIIFIFIFVYNSIFFEINLTILFISLFLLMSANDYNEAIYSDYLNKTNKDYANPLEIKTFIITNDYNKSLLYKNLSKKYYSQFVVVDKNKRIIQKFNENNLFSNDFNLLN